MSKRLPMTGYAAWNYGAQKGVFQPPYIVRWRGRWWRTLPLSAPPGQSHLSPGDVDAIRALGALPFGMRRCMDYLARTQRQFSALPIYPADPKEELRT